jgi:hypothetical protein
MSLTPSIVVASLPALRLASQSIKVALETGADFASHLGAASKTDPPVDAALARPANRSHPLNDLLPRLQQFLQSIGVNDSNAVELRTNAEGNIEVEGAPEVKPAVEQWLKENPEWVESWQAAAQKFLAELPARFPGAPTAREAVLPSSSLRSRISASSAEHSYR